MNKKVTTGLTIASWITLFAAIFVLIFLALDVFTLPYLTPFAHLLKAIVMPFVPLLAPLYLGAFIKTYRHAPFPARRQWMFTTGSLVFQQCGRVVDDMISLYEWNTLWNGKGFDANKVCGLNSCMGAWVQAGMFAVVILGECTGAKWDGGYVQKWIDAVAEDSIKEQGEKSGVSLKKDLEKGQVDMKIVERLDEKKPLI